MCESHRAEVKGLFPVKRSQVFVGPFHKEQHSPFLVPSERMEKDGGHMTERMLNLTLEIIYLLTGENYIAFKLSEGLAASNLKITQSSDTKPVPASLIPESNDKKIQEVTHKMIELLTGEVPIRGQDVSVYFSKEERQHLQGEKDICKDVTMDIQPSLPSPDGSGNKTPPERCPSPVYAQHPTQEDQKTPQDFQDEDMNDVKLKIENVSSVQTNARSDEPCNVQKVAPEVSTGSSNGAQERCPAPVYTQRSSRKDHKTSHHPRGQDLIVIKIEDTDDEETDVSGDEENREEEIPPEISADPRVTQRSLQADEERHVMTQHEEIPEISTDGRYVTNNLEKHPVFSPGGEVEDDNIADAAEENGIIPNYHGLPHGADLSSDPSTHGGSFPDQPLPVSNPSISWGDIMGQCYEMNDCFPQNAKLHARRKAQKVTESVSCSECGKSFAHKSNLVTHERIHNSNRPYPCSICGKRFTQKSHLVTHKRIHTGEKPFSCLTCGKSFTDKSNLVAHERTHTGLKPYFCPECGKSFGRRAYLLDHQREKKCDKWSN
ncbi:gastrula zinc finger protein XlCGF53.1-like isoform X2 [Hyperolius riggenbachi]|uniref:gastrula zinc finger protein XlCGF53.1-like isoform X2 n=1 Tax=Hyperolius riggenbachi TaxID=752182 RepID=UPI0035A26ACF